jgi:hypothetical protein
MATEVYCRVVPGGLMAANQAEASKLEDLVGKEVKARLTQPRNPSFHRKYFALLKVGHDMANTAFNLEQFRAYCQAGAGYCEWVEGSDGLIAIPRSISWASMDELHFQRLYNDVLSFICEKWALDENQINEIVRFM